MKTIGSATVATLIVFQKRYFISQIGHAVKSMSGYVYELHSTNQFAH
jgi:hypothetical protein